LYVKVIVMRDMPWRLISIKIADSISNRQIKTDCTHSWKKNVERNENQTRNRMYMLNQFN